jgi:hypothetical protein
VTHQLLAFTDDVNLPGDNTKRETETLIDARKEVSLEINAEKIKYMLLSHHQNAGQNHDTIQIFGNDNNKSKFNSGGKLRGD